MIARKIIFLNSSQASVKSLTTGFARFDYPQPIEPYEAPVKVAVQEFSYTNFFINITAPNNVINYSDDPLLPLKYAIAIPTGSWGIADLNDFILSTQLAQVGVAQSIFSLNPNYSTGHVYIQFGNVSGWYVHFTATSPSILGFGVQDVPVGLSNTAYYIEQAPNQASFNSIIQVKILSDIASDSIDNSALSSNVIFISNPSVLPGSVQVDTPANLLTIESAKLTTKVSSISIWVVDQNGAPINLSEDFSLTLLII